MAIIIFKGERSAMRELSATQWVTPMMEGAVPSQQQRIPGESNQKMPQATAQRTMPISTSKSMPMPMPNHYLLRIVTNGLMHHRPRNHYRQRNHSSLPMSTTAT